MEYNDERTPVVRVVARRDDGKIIVARKTNLKKWELPGGKIKADENRFKAARRELEEETGLNAGKFVDLARVEIEDENGCANAFIVYTDNIKGEAKPVSNEHDKVNWVKPENYKDLEFHYHSAYSVPSIQRLEKYLQNRDI